MNPIFYPWHLMVIFLASWIKRQQQEVIEYLRAENQVLKEKLGKKRILLDDDQRRRLALKGKILGRKLLDQVGTLFTPDTILRWHRQLIAGVAVATGSLWMVLNLVGLLGFYMHCAPIEERALAKAFTEYGHYLTKTGRFLPRLVQS